MMNKRLVSLFVCFFLALSFQVQAEELQRGASRGAPSKHAAKDAQKSVAKAAVKTEKQAQEKGAAKKADAFVKTININTASSSNIAEMLKGVGPAKAAAIVEFRSKNGPFKSLEELQQVKGLGAKTLAKNRAVIRFK